MLEELQACTEGNVVWFVKLSLSLGRVPRRHERSLARVSSGKTWEVEVCQTALPISSSVCTTRRLLLLFGSTSESMSGPESNHDRRETTDAQPTHRTYHKQKSRQVLLPGALSALSS